MESIISKINAIYFSNVPYTKMLRIVNPKVLHSIYMKKPILHNSCGFDQSYYSNNKMNKAAIVCTSSNGESRLDGKRRNDVIIVGAGVAGSALAHALGKDGRNVHVIERNLNEPNTIVGELLQPAGYLKLLELGLDDCVKEIDAQMVHGYVLYKDGKSIRLPYPLEKYDNDVSGRSFHHGRFVQRMREKAASLPNVKLVQGTATSLIEERGTIKGVKYRTRGGEESTVYAPLTVVCDGCFSNFRKFLSKPKISKPSHFAGFIMEKENCQVTHPNHAYVVLGNPSTLLMYPISSTKVRLLIDFSGTKLPPISNGQMARFLKNVVAPQVPSELYSAFIESVDKAQIKVMPTNCMPASARLIPGAVLLGDALNMRHAITGGGMTVALHDVVTLSNLFRHLNFDDVEMVLKYTQHFYNVRKPMAFTINVLADSLAKAILSPTGESRDEIQEACFNYMSLGHNFTRGLVGLISGLNPRPSKLVLHLSPLATYLIASTLIPVPSLKRVRAVAQLAKAAVAIIISIISEEDPREVFSIVKAFFGSPSSLHGEI